MTHYLQDKIRDLLKNNKINAAHVLQQVEKEVLETVMVAVRYNQSRAARELGMSRGTLRTLLKKYFNLKYIGTRS